MVSTLISEQATQELSIISLSNDTVKRRIDGLKVNIKKQLLERIHLFPYFALQLDKSMDINKTILPCYIRYQHEKSVLKDILFIDSLVHKTAEEIFNNLSSTNEFITSHVMD